MSLACQSRAMLSSLHYPGQGQEGDGEIYKQPVLLRKMDRDTGMG